MPMVQDPQIIYQLLYTNCTIIPKIISPLGEDHLQKKANPERKDISHAERKPIQLIQDLEIEEIVVQLDVFKSENNCTNN